MKLTSQDGTEAKDYFEESKVHLYLPGVQKNFNALIEKNAGLLKTIFKVNAPSELAGRGPRELCNT